MKFSKSTVDMVKQWKLEANIAIALGAFTTTLGFTSAVSLAQLEDRIVDAWGCMVCVVLALITTIVAVFVKRYLLLYAVDLKRNQLVYSINFFQLDICVGQIDRLSPDGEDRMIILRDKSLPKHENLYTSEKDAQKALDCFLNELYSNVKSYVGVDSLNADVMAEIRKGYMVYLANHPSFDPQNYDVSEVVMAAAKYHKHRTCRTKEKAEARECLRNNISNKN